jgi:pyrimidine deaminase RibD-like protein
MKRHYFETWTVGLAAAMIVFVSNSQADDEAEKAQLSRKIAAQSVYLHDTLEGAHQLGLNAVLTGTSGKGSLTLDPNTCSLDDFGDPQICTKIAVRSVPVELKQVKLADPTGAGRRLYEVAGEGLENELLLVVPAKLGAMRVISQDASGAKHVVTLEPVSRARDAANAGQLKARQLKATVLAKADADGDSAKRVDKGEKAAEKGAKAVVKLPSKKKASQLLTGTSEKLSFEEALENAINQIKLPFPDALLEYSIAAMGGEVGGITGKRSLSITIQVHTK